jgi:hypothetical protein
MDVVTSLPGRILEEPHDVAWSKAHHAERDGYFDSHVLTSA